MTAAESEIARLRRELEYAIEAARENGKERDELARALGEEVATTQRLRAALKEIGLWAETCLSLGATNAGLRRLIGKVDDALHGDGK